jgi:hypothetical protein
LGNGRGRESLTLRREKRTGAKRRIRKRWRRRKESFGNLLNMWIQEHLRLWNEQSREKNPGPWKKEISIK